MLKQQVNGIMNGDAGEASQQNRMLDVEAESDLAAEDSRAPVKYVVGLGRCEHYDHASAKAFLSLVAYGKDQTRASRRMGPIWSSTGLAGMRFVERCFCRCEYGGWALGTNGDGPYTLRCADWKGWTWQMDTLLSKILCMDGCDGCWTSARVPLGLLGLPL